MKQIMWVGVAFCVVNLGYSAEQNVLINILNYVNNLKFFQASFTQIQKKSKKKGKIFFAKPSRLRIDYHEGQPINIVCNEYGVFVHNYAFNHVTQIAKEPQELFPFPQGVCEEDVHIVACDDSCDQEQICWMVNNQSKMHFISHKRTGELKGWKDFQRQSMSVIFEDSNTTHIDDGVFETPKKKSCAD